MPRAGGGGSSSRSSSPSRSSYSSSSPSRSSYSSSSPSRSYSSSSSKPSSSSYTPSSKPVSTSTQVKKSASTPVKTPAPVLAPTPPTPAPTPVPAPVVINTSSGPGLMTMIAGTYIGNSLSKIFEKPSEPSPPLIQKEIHYLDPAVKHKCADLYLNYKKCLDRTSSSFTHECKAEYDLFESCNN